MDFYERFGEVHVDIVDKPMEDCVDIRFKRYVNGVKHLANFVKGPKGMTVIEWEQVKEGQVLPEHLRVRLSRDVARFLFDGLRKVIEKSKDSLDGEHTEALLRHLADMRAITFNSLRMKDPTSPIYADFNKINPEVAEMVAAATGRTIIDKEYKPED